MIRVEFSPEVIDALDHERYHHPSPAVQRKMEALYPKSTGMPHKEICRISKTTLAAYLKQYRDDGLEGLKVLRYKGQPSQLLDHKDSLEAYFLKHLPRTTAEAQDAIEKITGIKRSPTQVRALLKRIGMK
jgi:transposase